MILLTEGVYGYPMVNYNLELLLRLSGVPSSDMGNVIAALLLTVFQSQYYFWSTVGLYQVF